MHVGGFTATFGELTKHSYWEITIIHHLSTKKSVTWNFLYALLLWARQWLLSARWTRRSLSLLRSGLPRKASPPKVTPQTIVTEMVWMAKFILPTLPKLSKSTVPLPPDRRAKWSIPTHRLSTAASQWTTPATSLSSPHGLLRLTTGPTGCLFPTTSRQ